MEGCFPVDSSNFVDIGIISHIIDIMHKLDELDKKILRELQQDASTPIEELGEKVGLSRNACWRRIKLLEENKVIQKRVALASPDALGLGLQVFIAVRTDDHHPSWLDRFSRAVKEIPEITGAYRMTGELDYLIRARISDIKDYDALYQRLIRRVAMSDVSASFVMEEIKETTALPTD
jgi:Lrp/AsnC family transcriptional regulator